MLPASIPCCLSSTSCSVCTGFAGSYPSVLLMLRAAACWVKDDIHPHLMTLKVHTSFHLSTEAPAASLCVIM
jgi:hypothetical protein